MTAMSAVRQAPESRTGAGVDRGQAFIQATKPRRTKSAYPYA
jgi:hypothetical protein